MSADPLASPPPVESTPPVLTGPVDGAQARVVDAATGADGPDAQRIARLGLQWIDTILRKNHDYGGSVWKTPILTPGLSPGTAILVRMSDKIERLRRLLQNSDAPRVASETLDDTIGDQGAYCLLYLARPRVAAADDTEGAP